MHNFLEMTNASKAGILAFVSSAISLLTAFGLELSAEQVAAINIFVNSAIGLWVAVTYKSSHKRLPDDTIAVVTKSNDIEAHEPFFQEVDYDEEGNFKDEDFRGEDKFNV